MKKLTAFIFAAAIAFSAFSQNVTDDVYYSGKAKQKTFSVEISDASAEENAAAIANMRYCLDQFQEQQKIATYISILGGAFAAVGPTTMPDSNVPYYVGGGISLTGLVFYIDSFKWLQRASVQPNKDGMSFIFEF